MCFFGGGSKKSGAVAVPAPAPVPDPAPVPVPSDPNPVETADQRRKRTENLRQGVLSTIKTSASGTTGSGPDLQAAAASGMFNKTKMGL